MELGICSSWSTIQRHMHMPTRLIRSSGVDSCLTDFLYGKAFTSCKTIFCKLLVTSRDPAIFVLDTFSAFLPVVVKQLFRDSSTLPGCVPCWASCYYWCCELLQILQNASQFSERDCMTVPFKKCILIQNNRRLLLWQLFRSPSKVVLFGKKLCDDSFKIQVWGCKMQLAWYVCKQWKFRGERD